MPRWLGILLLQPIRFIVAQKIMYPLYFVYVLLKGAINKKDNFQPRVLSWEVIVSNDLESYIFKIVKLTVIW